MVLSALFLPFYITAIIFLAGVIFLEKFYFGILVFFFMDVVYGFNHYKIGPFYGLLTISSILIYVVASYAKKKLIRVNTFSNGL